MTPNPNELAGQPEALQAEMLDDLIATFEGAGRGNYNLMRVELPRHQWTQLAATLRAQAAERAVPEGWREEAQRCLDSMDAAVRWRETGVGRPPEQTCMDSIAELQRMLSASPAPEPAPATQKVQQCSHDWTKETSNNGWRSMCRLCGISQRGSGQ